MNALVVQNAVKQYKNTRALNGVDLTVPDGQFFGLLGPNGAGKTTLIQSLVGLVRLTQGSVHIYGHDIHTEYRSARSFIGYSPQDVNFERFFSIEKALTFQAGYFGFTKRDAKIRVEALLEQFGLTEKRKMPFFKLSGGMQKRALIAKALVSKPKLLILDEPTAGVDVEQRHELWHYLKHLNAKGTTILLTTHYIDEAEYLCENIAMINKGKIIETGSPKELIGRHCKPSVEITTQTVLTRDRFSSIQDFSITLEANKIIATGAQCATMTNALLTLINQWPQVKITDISTKAGSLEDVFLSINKNEGLKTVA